MKRGDIFYTTKLGYAWFYFTRYGCIPCRYRIDPVPATGRKRYCKHWGTYYRRMKTTQERKWSFAYPEYTRKRRNANNLVNSWEDIIRSDLYDSKSWKKYKKKRQWMQRIPSR